MRLGKIQDIEINAEGYRTENINTIWFVQAPTITRNIQLRAIRERKFKISDILTKEGFQINDKEQFGLELRILLLKTLPPIGFVI